MDITNRKNKLCKNCGVEIPKGEKTCPFCGTAVDENLDASKDSYKNDRVTKKSSPLPIVIGCVMVLLIIAVAVTGVRVYGSPKAKSDRQLSLGNKYLEELDYDRAIAAYRAAIEIDPKNAAAYKALADIYVEMNDIENAVAVLEEGIDATGDEELKKMLSELKNPISDVAVDNAGNTDLSIANSHLDEQDYDAALEMYLAMLDEDPMNADAYLGIVEVYLRRGDYDTALKYAKEGYDKTGDERLLEKINMIESGNISDSRGNRLKMTVFDENGNIKFWHEYTYDKDGRENGVTSYDVNGNQISHVDEEYTDEHVVSYWWDDTGIIGKEEFFIDSNGRYYKGISYDEDGNIDNYMEFEYSGDSDRRSCESYYDENYVLSNVWEYTYDSEGRETEVHITYYDNEGSILYDDYQTREYDSDGRLVKYSGLDGDRNVLWYDTYEYDENGNMIREFRYDGDGTLNQEITYE